MTAEAWFLLAAFVVLQGVFILVLLAGRRRITELERQLLTALGIITEKNDALRECEAANTALHDRNERLHHDQRAMRERLPRLGDEGICGDRAPSLVGDCNVRDECELRHGHASEWHQVGSHRWRKAKAADVLGIPALADPDPTRPYIPTYEAGEDEQR